jgi:hypothetical protein
LCGPLARAGLFVFNRKIAIILVLVLLLEFQNEDEDEKEDEDETNSTREYEIMAGWIHQKLDQNGSVRLLGRIRMCSASHITFINNLGYPI